MSKILTNNATVYGDTFDPDLSNNVTRLTIIKQQKKECIIVPKVFSQCQFRYCLPNQKINLLEANLDLKSVRFESVSLENLLITPIPLRPGFAQVDFDVRIPMKIYLERPDHTSVILKEMLPLFRKSIVLYYPLLHSEIVPLVRLSTLSNQLSSEIYQNQLIISVGTFVIVTLVIPVQIKVPSLGYCPEPPECEEVSPIDICSTFLDPNLSQFPLNFYNIQF